ncbi:MAG: bifunctional oligoribonuclease/PAP phosphatase NrnA [Cryomorphaceae bacterium]|nr:bifunctional oligoribonuclease/PAP phosphatase NrnA [Cryomorphaceae bacterium]
MVQKSHPEFYTAFTQLLNNKDQIQSDILITAHQNPDGDALGSALGLFWFFKRLGIPSSVMMPNDFPRFLDWMPGSEDILIYDNDRKRGDELVANANFIFILDYNDLSRAGKDLCNPIGSAKASKFMIDHHIAPSNCADHYFSDPKQPSTSQMVIQLLMELNMHQLLGKEGASCLFTGIITDTGSFRFPLVTADTFKLTAALFELGIDHSEIYEKVYDSYDERRFRMLGYMLAQMEVLKEAGVCVLYLTKKQQEKENLQKGDTEGFVNYGLNLKGILVAAFFREDTDNIRISFRSKGNVDMNTFARQFFNGGGHLNAAGGSSYVSLKKTLENFKKEITQYMKQYE